MELHCNRKSTSIVPYTVRIHFHGSAIGISVKQCEDGRIVSLLTVLWLLNLLALWTLSEHDITILTSLEIYPSLLIYLSD